MLSSLRSRAALCAISTAVLVGLTPTGPTSAAPAPAAFRPQLVTVDTPSPADKDRLQGLGLDLTEHAGHDYVEVVLHSAPTWPPFRGPGSPTRSASPTWWLVKRRSTG